MQTRTHKVELSVWDVLAVEQSIRRAIDNESLHKDSGDRLLDKLYRAKRIILEIE